MQASILISNYEPKGQLDACVDHALAQDRTGPPWEVIFPAHGCLSAADHAALAARSAADPHRFRFLPGPYTDRASALNAAAAVARGDVLIFLESHVLAPPTLRSALCASLTEGTATLVQGAFVAPPSEHWVSTVETQLRADARERRVARGQRADEWHLHAAALRRETFLRAGGLPAAFADIAEVALFSELSTAGARVVELPTPAVHHVNHTDWSEYLGALERRGIGVAQLWRGRPTVAALEFPLPRRATWLMRSSVRRGLGSALLSLEAGLLAGLLPVARWTGRSAWVYVVARRAVVNAIRRGFLRG
jgi:hypothetical protein